MFPLAASRAVSTDEARPRRYGTTTGVPADEVEDEDEEVNEDEDGDEEVEVEEEQEGEASQSPGGNVRWCVWVCGW